MRPRCRIEEMDVRLAHRVSLSCLAGSDFLQKLAGDDLPDIIMPDRAGLTARVEISRFRAGKLVVLQQFEYLVERRNV